MEHAVGRLKTFSLAELCLELWQDEGCWVVEGLVGTGLTVLLGPPKTGKSWMALDLALCVSQGDPFLGRATAGCGVLYLADASQSGRIGKRLRLLDPEPGANLVFADEEEALRDGADRLDGCLDENPDIGLIVVDGKHAPRSAKHISSLRELAAKHRVAVLVLQVSGKQKGLDSQAMGMLGRVDGVMALSRRVGEEAWLSRLSNGHRALEMGVRLENSRWRLSE